MSRAVSKTIARTCFRLLLPLARVMLRNGVTAHQFSRLAEAAFVAAADEILKEQSRQSSFSRISSMTGLHRHAVSSVKAALDADEFHARGEKDYQRNRLARVLGGWFESPDFTDRDGRPRPLPLQGPGRCFEDLVRRFSGDIYPGIILDELQHAGAVRVAPDGTVYPVARRLLGTGADEKALNRLGQVASDVISTLEHNMMAAQADRLFEDSAVSVALPESALPMLRRWVERRAAPLLSDLEGWFNEREAAARGPTPAGRGLRAGVEITMFVDRRGSDPEKQPGDT